MKSLLCVPLLPESKVHTVFISYEYPNIIRTLNADFGIHTLKVNNNPDLDKSISNHADCLFVQIDKNTIFTESNNYGNIVNYLTHEIGEFHNLQTVRCINKLVESPYPKDVTLNIKVIGNKIICNTNYVASEIKEYAHEYGIQFIHTNQGYAACSTVVINSNALITDDESIYLSSKCYGIDALLISKGSVTLNGYNYGFIGGTCGMIDKNVLAFTGKLNSHYDFKKIISFLNKYNVNYIELTNEPLIDIGGIIPILV